MARWEPAHGPFKYRHPWQQYLKIGASMRTCAYCIETLRGYIHSELAGTQVYMTRLRIHIHITLQKG